MEKGNSIRSDQDERIKQIVDELKGKTALEVKDFLSRHKENGEMVSPILSELLGSINGESPERYGFVRTYYANSELYMYTINKQNVIFEQLQGDDGKPKYVFWLGRSNI